MTKLKLVFPLLLLPGSDIVRGEGDRLASLHRRLPVLGKLFGRRVGVRQSQARHDRGLSRVLALHREGCIAREDEPVVVLDKRAVINLLSCRSTAQYPPAG